MPGGGMEMMTVTSDLPEQIAGVQLEINYDPGSVALGQPSLTADNARFSLSYNDNGTGRMRVLLYHGAPIKTDELIQIGAADLLEVPIQAHTELKSGDKSKIRLTQVLLSTASAQAVAVDGVDPLMPASFVLHQNYPNPFNPTTTIAFTVSATDGGLALQPVRLDVFNILGRRVATLIDGDFPAGDHEVVWDATDDGGQRVASGVYLYRLTVGEQRQAKKMLFLK
jgi:hypothetical protein